MIVILILLYLVLDKGLKQMAYIVNGILFLHKVKLMRIRFFSLCESCYEGQFDKGID